MKWIRRFGVFLGLGVLAAALAYLLSFAFVVGAAHQDQRQPSDAIVVLGAAQYDGRPSPVFQARLDHALQLYEARLAPLIVLTGGVGRGDTASEAAVGERYLQSLEVPTSALVVRPEGRSTEASIRSVAEWLRAENLETVVLVSDPFHMGRLRLEAKRLGLTALTSPTRSSPISESSRRELGYFAREALKVLIAWVRTW